jgi:DNA-binding response OmpR family regulator
MQSAPRNRKLEAKTILLVDDDRQFAAALQWILADEKFIVDTAFDGEEALLKVKAHEYEVVICDMKMPRMRGDEFYLKARELRPSVADRFIFITGFATDPHITFFFDRNRVKYLVKPFAIQGLISCVNELLIQAELTAVRRSEEAKAMRLSQVEKELATTKRSEESMASRLSRVEKELAAARRVTEEKALRLSQVEAELARARISVEEARSIGRQVEQKQGPRKITPEQRAQFLNTVRGRPTGKVIVSVFFDHKETYDFGQEILNVVKEGGFEVIQSAPSNFFSSARPPDGVSIGCEDTVSPPPHFVTVDEGFRAIGVDAPITTLINAREKDVVEIQVTPVQQLVN